jgi:hypothetical protein
MVDMRRESRFKVSVSCRAETSEYTFSAKVVELSASGARIKFPIAPNTQELWDVRSVDIEGLGQFKVNIHWSSGDSVGLSFDAPGERVALFLRELGPKAIEV